jgi:hypothetical protein
MHKYCHNAGMAFAHHHGRLTAEGCQPEGSAIAIMAPRRGPQEVTVRALVFWVSCPPDCYAGSLDLR